MANRRMLARNIATSKKLARLKTDFARLCWTWGVPFHDEFGLFEADPEVFRATVVPLLRTATHRKIADALNDLAEVGLIRLYIKGDSLYGEYVKYDEFQTFKNDRKRKAEFPLPEQGDYILGIQWNPDGSIVPLREVKGSKEKLREVVTTNKDLLSLQESFLIYGSLDDDDLQSLSQEFPSIDIGMVLRDLLAWERGNKKGTTNPALRLRNFCKIASKGPDRGAPASNNGFMPAAEAWQLVASMAAKSEDRAREAWGSMPEPAKTVVDRFGKPGSGWRVFWIADGANDANKQMSILRTQFLKDYEKHVKEAL